MAETSNANTEDSRIWSPFAEKQFLLLLIEIASRETSLYGKRKSRNWRDIETAFNARIKSRIPYCSSQLIEKLKRLKKKYNLFSQLLRTPGMDLDDNIATGSPEAWAHALTLNKDFGKFRTQALNNYELLRQLSFLDGQTPSAQPDTAEGGHPTGTNTTSGLKRKAPSSDSGPCDGGPFSISKAISILNSMSDLSEEAYFEALEIIERPEKRETLMTMNPAKRLRWIERLARKP